MNYTLNKSARANAFVNFETLYNILYFSVSSRFLKSIALNASNLILVLTLVTSVSLHAPIFHTDLIGIHVWRQMQNQTNVRNYYRYDNNILNPRIPALNLGQDGNILRYEFPMLPWSIAQLQRVFGESIVITRVVLFIIGLLGLLGFYWLVSLIFKHKLIAALGTWVFSLSPIFYYYTMNPLSDVLAMSLQIWMMACTINYITTKRFRYFVYAAVLISLAGLAKLPYFLFGIMPLAATLIMYHQAGRSVPLFIKSLFILVICTLPVLAWYTFAIRSWQSMGVLNGIFGGTNLKDLTHFLSFHVLSWLPRHLTNPIGMFFLIVGFFCFFKFRFYNKNLLHILGAGLIVLCMYYLYELNMISTVHDYYLLPFLVFIHLFICYGLYWVWKLEDLRYVLIGLLAIMPLTIYPRINDEYWSIDRNGYNVDWFTYSDSLKKAAPRDSLCIILNDNTGVVMPYQIDKQGYVFDKDDLPAMWIEDMILRRRATYMYSDSRKVDTSAAVLPYLDSLIIQAGTIKVFRLIASEDIE